ncbi:MAG TPA: ADP-ribose pyrophosphatase [Ruminiclostridium sp.]|nr:ADP-ribose pyrophosphatase [Ruminiclostridium sp.]
MNYYEKTLNTESVYHGSIIDVERLTVELPNGRRTTRDVVRNPGASAIVPVTDDGKIILVEQFRKPIEKVSLEIPAGKLDKGENPDHCAVRELQEETGYTSKNIRKILTINPVGAYADEVIHIYLATELSAGKSHPDEDEFISAKAFSFDEIMSMIEKSIITDSKTIAAILFAARLLKIGS